MKSFRALILIVLGILLVSCNLTLAEDVTPPPGYVPPTPAPTLGPLFPEQAPNVDNGAAIFAEKCSPCHGTTGMGDGPDGKQLPVTVPALGVPEIARRSTPSEWYAMVTQGNLERFMPPFASLNNQQRWDVVAYAISLHYTNEQINAGQPLYEANCTTCHSSGFTQEQMAAKADDALAAYVTKGHDKFDGSKLTEDDAYVIAAYMRSLSFAAPQPTATAVSATETSSASDAATPNGTEQAEVTPEASTAPGLGMVRGTVDNRSGETLPADLEITLRAYEHGGDPNAGPAEIFTVTTTLQSDGTYLFENVEIPENRIFITEFTFNGLLYRSDYAIVQAGQADVEVAPILLYGTTDDFGALQIPDLTIFFDYGNDGSIQIFSVYTLVNNSDSAVMIKLKENEEIPFMTFPVGSKGLGYEVTQDSAAFMQTADGFGVPPSENSYGLIAFAVVPADGKVEQNFMLDVDHVTVLVPEGVTIDGSSLNDDGLVDMQQSSKFHSYSSDGFKAGETLSFSLSGSPTVAAPASETATGGLNQNLLIGIGALGLVLIGAGAWLYLRDRRQPADDEEDEVESEFDTSEEVMDAILALDDLHRAGNMSDEAYKKRRAELKDELKNFS